MKEHTTSDIEYLDEIITFYNLDPASQRNLSLLTMSCIGLSYGKLLRGYLGFTYEAIVAVGDQHGWQTLFNEPHIKREMERFISVHPDSLEEKAFAPAQRIVADCREELAVTRRMIRDDPRSALRRIIDFYPILLAGIGIYNCFWRYLGNANSKGPLTSEMVHRLARARDSMTKIYPQVEDEINDCLLEMKQHDPASSVIPSLLRDELVHYLETKHADQPLQEEVERRKAGYVYAYVEREGREHVFTDPDVVAHVKAKYIAVNDASIKEVMGHGVFPGVVRGKVRNIQRQSVEQAGINEACVLVTSMTHPNDLPYVKRCAAIVTDEGGVLSHAAIVAREMKIPCVIGTKIATQIFKDGDMVEVDAERGIVSKLS